MSPEQDKDILISIVIPVKNGDAWLNETLPAICQQTLFYRTEIIVIDSGSTDGTREILKQYPVRTIDIPSESFNHGATRNLGVAAAKGKYVVMTVQDAKPASNDWLEFLLGPFEDERIAAVCGQQIVPHNISMNPMEWFRPVSPPALKKYYFPNRQDFERLPPDEQKNCCSWDNVNAMYRKECLLAIPFKPVEFGEDMQWAKDALEAGYGIAYETHARVEHYHYYSFDSYFTRNFIKDYQVYKFFGIVPGISKTSFLSILKDMKWLGKEKGIRWGDKWKWLKYNIVLRKSARLSDELFMKTYTKGEDKLEYLQEQLTRQKPQALKPINF